MNEQRVTLPGQRLRAEREARGMSELEVARQLNLTVTYLKALEADDYERLPQATFIRGYIRNYARLLEIPSDDLVRTFDEVMEDEAASERAEEQEAARPARRRSSQRMLAGAALVVLAALVWWGMSDSGQEGGPPAQESAATESSPASEMIAGEDSADTAEPEAVTGGQTQQGEPGAGAPAAAPEAAPEPEPQSPDTLVMSFTESCWVEVDNAAGERLFAGQKPAGGRLSLEGQGPFSVKVGNAAAVSLVTVNGKVVEPPSSAPGDVVRFPAP